MDPLLITVFAVAVAIGAAAITYAIRSSAKTEAEQKALADAQGWTRTHTRDNSGSTTTFESAEEGWRLDIFTGRSNTGSSNRTSNSVRWTMFTHPGVGIDRGMAVLGPDIPEKMRAMADKMMGLMGGDIGRFLLDKITGGLGTEAQGLRTVESDAPGHMMVSPGAEGSLDAIRDLPELLAAREGLRDNDQPIVMRGPFGLRLRVSSKLKSAKDIEDFVALGRLLSVGVSQPRP